MSTNRLFQWFASVIAVVVFALPAASALAMPSIDTSTGASASHPAAPNRAAYYEVKERQLELSDATSLRFQSTLRQSRRLAPPLKANRYAAFKEWQAEQFMIR